MANTINSSKNANFDTSLGKIGNFEESKNEISAEGEANFSSVDKGSEQKEVISRNSSSEAEKIGDYSLNNTERNPSSERASKNQISDTSTKTIDPLSVIGYQDTQKSAENTDVDNDENLVFSKLFPSVSLEKIKQDELFCLFSCHNGKNLTISELYGNYLRFVGMIEGDFAKKSLISLQNKLLSPGPLASSDKSGEVFFTKEQVLKMSPAQISANYEIIRNSQQKW